MSTTVPNEKELLLNSINNMTNNLYHIKSQLVLSECYSQKTCGTLIDNFLEFINHIKDFINKL